jgi:hypothetical protein
LNFWGTERPHLSDVLSQVRGTMLLTVFVFVGIEGASVYSRYARDRSDIGIATVVGFLTVLCLLVLVTLLSYGVLPREALAGLPTPSMAGVMESMVGRWGSIFISVGLLISILGNYLSWSLLAAEVLHSAALNRTMPSFLASVNAHEVPVGALWLTNIVIQTFVLVRPEARVTRRNLCRRRSGAHRRLDPLGGSDALRRRHDLCGRCQVSLAVVDPVCTRNIAVLSRKARAQGSDLPAGRSHHVCSARIRRMCRRLCARRWSNLDLNSRWSSGDEHEYPGHMRRLDPRRIGGDGCSFNALPGPIERQGHAGAEGNGHGRARRGAQHQHEPDEAPLLASSRRRASALR